MSVKTLNPTRFSHKPTAVLFDLDNTLYPYEPSHEAGMSAVRSKAVTTIGIDTNEFDTAFNNARTDTKKQLGMTASAHSRLLYFQRTLEYLGLRSQMLLSLEFEHTYWSSYLAAIKLREGVIDFLDQLARINITKVLVTDLTAQIQFRKLVYMELDRRFDYVVTSEESGQDKPNRASFTMAMNKLLSARGSTNIETQGKEVWMIGDNVTSDLEGAKTAINATTLALKSEIRNHAANGSIDMIFDSFTDLEKCVREKQWDDRRKIS